jgi:L-ascorbate metabolism protein UlaG (beta-lactamase superfamily)
MIPAVLSGETLLADIAAADPGAGEVCIWWLGQSGYAIKSARHLLWIDLYLSDRLTRKYAATSKPHIRMMEAPLTGGQISGARWVLSSHKHTDHFDPDTLTPLFGNSPEARLILPLANAPLAREMGLTDAQLLPTRGDERLELADGLTIHSLPSAHPNLDFTPETGYSFLGFVLQMDGVTLYHSGDTLAYPGLGDRLLPFQPDILFLPINGHPAHLQRLGVPPNMNAEEALALAREVRPRLVIPHHYDLFSFNTADVGRFADRARELRVPYTVLRPGERYRWPGE